MSHSPSPHAPAPQPASNYSSRSPHMRAAVWVAIGSLVAAAVICVAWVLLSPQTGSVVRAFLTVLLFAGFSWVAIWEARQATQRPTWYAMASIATWVVALLSGIILIWMPEWAPLYGVWAFVGPERIIRFVLVVAVLQLGLLHARMFMRLAGPDAASPNRVIAPIAVGLVGLLVFLILLPLVFGGWLGFTDFYWRIVVSVVIFAAVGSAIVPLLNVLFLQRPEPTPPVGVSPEASAAPVAPSQAPTVTASEPSAEATASEPTAEAAESEEPDAAPRAPEPESQEAVAEPELEPEPAPAPAVQEAAQPADETAELLPWPFYIDGITPLPMLPDGTPDWNAYYTGQPTPGAQVFAPIAPPPAPQA